MVSPEQFEAEALSQLLLCPPMVTQAGPSNPAKRQKQKKNAQLMRTKHAKRADEEKKLTQLEEAARDFELPNGQTAFSILPISEQTKKGLKKAYFEDMTDIQARSIPLSLKGKDVLGAARTGSGKTLAFLVPVLEMLYRKKWGPQDGLGALIISPTRELAMQIFDVLRRIGGYHSFSAGLVIGGKNLKDEQDRLSRMNILVATPGRLLQHMDQTIGFEAHNLQVLVLDEADRILDMGFARALNAIVSHLPKTRQTLLFSATQTRSVQDLARLSLDNPVFVGTQDEDAFEATLATPKNLEQHYLVCDLDKKLDVLYSFIRTHLKAKIIVFMSSGKQVRFVFETFCKLQPGIPLLHIHGKQKQTKRLSIYQKFTTSSQSVLFATDIAARGLDFPAIDWVIQLDAPEDAETYIHRVGRTARYESAGRALLFLLPSEEEGMVNSLKHKSIQVEKIKAKQSKVASITHQLQNFAFKEPEIKYLAQRAFISYMKSIYLQKDKSIFKLEELPSDKFAIALGLPGTPKIKFLRKDAAQKKKNVQRVIPGAEEIEVDDLSSSEEEKDSRSEDEVPVTSKTPAVRTKYDRMFERKNQNILSEHYNKLIDHSTDDILGDAEDDDDFITLQRVDHDLEGPAAEPLPLEPVSKRKLKESKSKKAMLKYKEFGKKIIFDDEGRPHELYEMRDDKAFREANPLEVGREFAEKERNKLKELDILDKEEARDKKREKKRKRKERERAKNSGGAGVTLATGADDGYESPDLVLPGIRSDDESEVEERMYHPAKRARKSGDDDHGLEELALEMLRGQ